MNSIHDKKFFSGGNALFTVSNNKGDHYTFKIRKPREDAPYFINLLTGPQNTSNFTYMGIYNPDSLKVVLTKKSKFNYESTPVKVLVWAIRQVAFNKELPEGYKIQHEGRCCRCGRTLTTPESIEKGIGPECAKVF